MMREGERRAVQEVHAALARLIRARRDGAPARLRVTAGFAPNEVELSGDPDGLLLLAAAVLRTAMAAQAEYGETVEADGAAVTVVRRDGALASAPHDLFGFGAFDARPENHPRFVGARRAGSS